MIRKLGREDYATVFARMREFTNMRTDETPDEIWLVEHPPVFTQGVAGKQEHVLAAGEIPVVQTDRGGQVTYHGPGQIVVYPLLNLKRLKIGPKALVHGIEQVLIDFLNSLNIQAERRDGAPGVYVNQSKIASLGLRIRNGCCYHGLALNIDMDLSPFTRIHPCGYAGLMMCQVRDFVAAPPPIFAAGEQLALAINTQFQLPRSNPTR